MTRKYKVIDADGHVLEPLSLWNDYMDAKFRQRAPRVVIDAGGIERLTVDGVVIDKEPEQGIGRCGAVGARQGTVSRHIKYQDGKPGGFDPHKRIIDMDSDGIDAAFLYPTLGIFACAVKEPDFAAAWCRAYNRWLADYCKPYTDRLFGAAMLPMQSPELAIEELRFARKELGFRGAFIRPNPYHNKNWDHPDYEPFWAAAEDLDISIGFHEGASGDVPQIGTDRFSGRGTKHLMTHPMEAMLACMSMVWLGVCQRHPKLRIGFLESGGGWVAPWIDRMDRHFDDQGFNDTGLKTRPSEIFRRNCWISFEPVEGCLKVLAEYIGPNKIMWATDYPHPDGFFPGAPDMVRKIVAGLSAETQYQVMAGGALSFYGMS